MIWLSSRENRHLLNSEPSLKLLPYSNFCECRVEVRELPESHKTRHKFAKLDHLICKRTKGQIGTVHFQMIFTVNKIHIVQTIKP